jgi:Sulfotransferase family
MSTDALIDTPDVQPASTDPVFILCNGRSGSTLLRFLIDAHPDLACPPETNLPSLCGQLANVWSLIEGAPLSANRGDEPPAIPDNATAGIRDTVDRMLSSYLERRGKKRYCDKSLGTSRLAEMLVRIYPGTRFICLYRHPMDVIASGIEACPWGLNGYGFDPYIAMNPGNSVMAMARFWVDNTATTLAAEEHFSDISLRVRYEDLVADPEAMMDRVFGFLDVAPAHGVSRSCFSSQRERFGPGDHKIWYTSEVTADSVGRGWKIPIGMVPPPLLESMNALCSKLGYSQVDGNWGSSPPDPRTLIDSSNPDQSGSPQLPPSPAEGIAEPRYTSDLGTRLKAGLAGAGRERAHWEPCAAETMVAVAIPENGDSAEYWQVSLGSGDAVFSAGSAQENSDWDIVGSTEAWNKVLSGKLNLSVALRSCELRYCENAEIDTPVAADTRITILAELLGLANWQG